MVMDRNVSSFTEEPTFRQGARRLTHKQDAFAREVVAGASLVDAYRRTYSPHAGAWAYGQAHQTAKLPHVRERIAQLTAQADSGAVLTRMEKRGLLAACARNDGNEWPHRLAAIKVDNEMSGDSKIRIEGEVTLGVILAAISSTTGLLREDEKALLRSGAIDVSKIATPPRTATTEPGHTPAAVPGPLADDFAKMRPGCNERNKTRPRAQDSLRAVPPTRSNVHQQVSSVCEVRG